MEGFCKKKRVIDIKRANLYALGAMIPLAVLFVVPFYLLWPDKISMDISLFGFSSPSVLVDNIIVLTVILLGIVLHELLHALGWVFFTKHGVRSIKFGFMVKMLTPYCHCREPLKWSHYVIGALLPGVVLGLFPAIIAIFIGNFALLGLGLFFILAAMGDVMIFAKLLHEDRDSLIEDHPTEAGYFVYLKSETSENEY